MRFEWDEAKNLINKKIHHMPFEYAARVWQDERRIERFDDEHSRDEERWITIGLINNVVFVVFTYRGEDCVRLISARAATREEQNEYYSYYDA
ncbi:MAG: BrnT family toxin [Desulfovibrionaceae bacterium]|nr:BrnT family toxin [Desulfovibrionaceae bacterium]